MLRTTGARRAPHLFVILWPSKERSDAAQTPGAAPQPKGSMPRPLCAANDAEFRCAAILGNRHGMDPRVKPVKPEDDEPVGVPFLEGGLEAVTSLGLWLRLPDFLNGHVQRRFKGVP
jgi:hypothetical protein